MEKLSSIDEGLGVVELPKADELKIVALVSSVKQFIEELFSKQAKDRKVSKETATFMKKRFMAEVDSSVDEIKRSFIMAGGLVYPLLKSIGNAITRAVVTNAKTILLKEALVVFEKNMTAIFSGEKPEKSFEEILDSGLAESINTDVLVRQNQSNASLLQDLESITSEELSYMESKNK